MKNLLLILCLILIVSCKKEDHKTSENDVLKDTSTSKVIEDSLKSNNDLSFGWRRWIGKNGMIIPLILS